MLPLYSPGAPPLCRFRRSREGAGGSRAGARGSTEGAGEGREGEHIDQTVFSGGAKRRGMSSASDHVLAWVRGFHIYLYISRDLIYWEEMFDRRDSIEEVESASGREIDGLVEGVESRERGAGGGGGEGGEGKKGAGEREGICAIDEFGEVEGESNRNW